jgi:hypothetical protein
MNSFFFPRSYNALIVLSKRRKTDTTAGAGRHPMAVKDLVIPLNPYASGDKQH